MNGKNDNDDDEDVEDIFGNPDKDLTKNNQEQAQKMSLKLPITPLGPSIVIHSGCLKIMKKFTKLNYEFFLSE